ncbi:hypothetical protein H7J07_00450 [Mycobacterium koreense]|nr:hypothetical protein [Mycolicibacillus koreensis]MCV7246729.1 hypothetical protein [Mycolicibacillus koreensis]BBY52932.1 hypothetical protein MKOR_01830 [Mycolicibacillus koreensis]
MSTTSHPASIETWRDVADQLTDAEVSEFEAAEQAGEHHRILRENARAAVWGRQYAHIAAPAGTNRTHEWEQFAADEPPQRLITGDRWPGRTVTLTANGFQRCDGMMRSRWVHVYVNPSDDTLTADEARELAARLVEAADFLDGFGCQREV